MCYFIRAWVPVDCAISFERESIGKSYAGFRDLANLDLFESLRSAHLKLRSPIHTVIWEAIKSMARASLRTSLNIVSYSGLVGVVGGTYDASIVSGVAHRGGWMVTLMEYSGHTQPIQSTGLCLIVRVPKLSHHQSSILEGKCSTVRAHVLGYVQRILPKLLAKGVHGKWVP